MTGRERDIALEADRDFEPTIKDVFIAISTMSKSIIVRNEIKAEIAEALQLVSKRLGDLEQLASRASAETKNLNERVVAQEQVTAHEGTRIAKLEVRFVH